MKSIAICTTPRCMWKRWAMRCSTRSCWSTRRSPIASGTSSPACRRCRCSSTRPPATWPPRRGSGPRSRSRRTRAISSWWTRQSARRFPPTWPSPIRGAARPALDAMAKFQNFLNGSLTGRDPSRLAAGAGAVTRASSVTRWEAGWRPTTRCSRPSATCRWCAHACWNSPCRCTAHWVPAHEDHADLSGEARRTA